MIHGQQKRIRCEAMFENEHILLVKAPFCASGVGSGLATRVSLILVSRGGVGVYILREADLLLITFRAAVCDCYCVRFKRHTL
jgi:hypothetical protein